MFKFQLSNIQAIDFDSALFDFNNPTYSKTDGTFSSSCPSNNSDFMSALDVKI